MSSEITLTIAYQDSEQVELHRDSNFEFVELDNWVRQRFNVTPGSQLAYYPYKPNDRSLTG